MVAIPAYGDPTLRVMEREVEKDRARKQERRDYLGASMVGDPCARKIWYQYNRFPAEETGFIGVVSAESGHYAEAATAARLRLVPGLVLHTHKEDGEQYGFSTFDGRFKGHYDGLLMGLIQAPRALHVWEHKDKDHKKFSDFQNCKEKYGEKNALENWDITYFGQAQVNMHYAKADRHYMTVSYAGARRYDSCRTEYQPEKAERLIDKAWKIINARSEPVRLSEKPDFFLCKFCKFREVCHEKR